MKSRRDRFLYGIGYVLVATGIWGLIAFGVILATLIIGWAIQGASFLTFISYNALRGPAGFPIAFAAFCFGLIAAIQAWASDKKK